MKTIVLRFSDSFAPRESTLPEHGKIIRDMGYAWWGKRDPRISPAIVKSTMASYFIVEVK